ncbi:MAG: hypothetical protein ACK40N_09335 [Meiothermus ruber]|jgi:hypothetical protein|uniref:Secreted protein n=1 Tax=Meiothermus ruber TaxID=277 RepID=A0A7C3DTH3_MEIRU
MSRWIFWLCLLGLALAQPQWTTYCNARFGFCLQRPAFMTPEPPPQNGDGQAFRRGAARLVVSGALDAYVFTLEEQFQQAQQNLRVSYKVLKPTYYAVSGLRGNRVVYEYKRLENGVFYTLYLEYPTAEKNTYDPLIKPMLDSFRIRR